MPSGIAIFRREPPPITGASNAGGVGIKRDSWRVTVTGFAAYRSRLQCCQPYESRSVKTEAATNGVEPSTLPLTAASVVRCSYIFYKTTTKCLWRARRYTPVNPPPGLDPLGHSPVFCFRMDRSRRIGPYFCWKLTLPVLLTLSDPRLGVLTSTDPRTAENKGVMT